MANSERTLQRVLRGDADRSIRFTALVSLLKALGFEERIRGDHHIFTRPNVSEIINVQPKGSLAKAYQVKQVRHIILAYRLSDAL